MFLIGPYSYPPGTMLSALQRLGLTTNLKVCLDAGDINSYDGTSQTWTDVSGGGYSFYRGTGSGSDAADPTFNGTAGRQSSSEFFSFDGADYCTLNQATPTWINNLHKDNALWATAGWLYITSISQLAGILGNNGLQDQANGVGLNVRTDGLLRVSVSKGATGGAIALGANSTGTLNLNAWNFFASQIDEAAGTGVLQVNATQDDFVSTYSGPTTNNAGFAFEIGRASAGVASLPLLSGSRLNCVSMWEASTPTKAQFLSLYNATKSKFL